MKQEFTKFDYENNEFPNLKYHQTWYCKKEIPNVLLTLSKIATNKQDDNTSEIYFDMLTLYYETYDTVTGWKVVMETPMMSPKVYELLTKQKYIEYCTQADNFWRNPKTGKDEGFIEPERQFNQMRIEHKLSADGKPALWYITLWQEEKQMSYQKLANLKEVKL